MMAQDSRLAMAMLGILLALGMSAAAYILGVQAKKVALGQQTITVKGLAVKELRADSAEWSITVSVTAPDFASALSKLRGERPALDGFLLQQELDKAGWTEGAEEVTPHMVQVPLTNGETRTEQQGYDAKQTVVVATKNLEQVVAASKDILNMQAQGRQFIPSSPLFLVSNLEDIKMSLIGAATANARKRAQEFVKQDGVKVGVMRSASQGAFYILPAGGQENTDEYGGVYDKTTIDKVAKVVVTIVYGIEQ